MELEAYRRHFGPLPSGTVLQEVETEGKSDGGSEGQMEPEGKSDGGSEGQVEPEAGYFSDAFFDKD